MQPPRRRACQVRSMGMGMCMRMGVCGCMCICQRKQNGDVPRLWVLTNANLPAFCYIVHTRHTVHTRCIATTPMHHSAGARLLPRPRALLCLGALL